MFDMRKPKATNPKAKRRVAYSIAAGARAAGVSRRRMMTAIALDQVRVVRFGRTDMIPAAEIERIRAEFDLSAK
ncbi:hypothetical protein CDS [Bradyrhizobium sp.]|nr:hypothetical protein CDS [Bradyrhizobium sp.]